MQDDGVTTGDGLEEEEALGKAVDRRTLLKAGGAAGVAGAVFLGGGTAAARTVAGSVGAGFNPRGKKRKLIYVTNVGKDIHFGSAFLPLLVGFRDVCALVGWQFQSFGPATTADFPQTINAQLQALNLKPDVIVTQMMDAVAFRPALEKIKKAGIYLVLTDVQPTAGNGLDLPFVGSDYTGVGSRLGELIATEVTKKGTKTGVILIGNSFPGIPIADGRARGIALGVKVANEKNKTSFTTDEFDDKAKSDLLQGVVAWKTKIRAIGDKFVGAAAVGFNSGFGALMSQKELKYSPGKFPIGSFDTSPELLQGVKDGYVTALTDGNRYMLGYLPADLAWQALERGYSSPPFIETSGLVTRANVNAIDKRDKRIIELAKKYGYKPIG